MTRKLYASSGVLHHKNLPITLLNFKRSQADIK